MKTPEEKKKDLVFAWMNKQIKATKLSGLALFDKTIIRNHPSREIQVYVGIREISKITGIPYVEADWDGNEHCHTDHTEYWLYYRGYKFFSLDDKK